MNEKGIERLKELSKEAMQLALENGVRISIYAGVSPDTENVFEMLRIYREDDSIFNSFNSIPIEEAILHEKESECCYICNSSDATTDLKGLSVCRDCLEVIETSEFDFLIRKAIKDMKGEEEFEKIGEAYQSRKEED